MCTGISISVYNNLGKIKISPNHSILGINIVSRALNHAQFSYLAIILLTNFNNSNYCFYF